MSKPEHRVDDFEEALLASAKADGMRPDRKAAVALVLGVGAGGSVVAAAGVAKAAGVASAAAKAKVAASVVVIHVRPRTTPRRPIARISRSIVQRATS